MNVTDENTTPEARQEPLLSVTVVELLVNPSVDRQAMDVAIIEYATRNRCKVRAHWRDHVYQTSYQALSATIENLTKPL